MMNDERAVEAARQAINSVVLALAEEPFGSATVTLQKQAGQYTTVVTSVTSSTRIQNGGKVKNALD